MTFQRNQATATIDWAEPASQFRYQPPPFHFDQSHWGPPNGYEQLHPQPHQHTHYGMGMPDGYGMNAPGGYGEPHYDPNPQHVHPQNAYQQDFYPQNQQNPHYDGGPSFDQPMEDEKREVPNFLKEDTKKKGFKIDFSFPTKAAKKTQNDAKTFSQTFLKEWIQKEYDFSMNKISMTGLIFGFMFLGSIFFLIGFLVGVNMYGTGSAPEQTQRNYLPTRSGMITARTGVAPMNAAMAPLGAAGIVMGGNAPIQNHGRMPSSLQQNNNAPQYQNRAPQRMPSSAQQHSNYMNHGSIQPHGGYMGSRMVH